jgi:hypothetical protein
MPYIYIFNLRELSPENFESFLRKIMSERSFESVPNDFVRKTSDESDEMFELKSKRSRIILQVLTVIAQAQTPLTDLEEFFNEYFKNILDYSYRSRLMTERVFEIFEKNFCENKTKVIEWITKGVRYSSFFLFSDDVILKSITPECRSCIDNFWIKLESFLDSNRELMRKLLMGGFGWSHPLIFSIYYDIESLQSFYLNYLETRELFSIFANNLDFVFKAYGTKNYENFFRNKFIIDESKKEELRTFKDEYGRTIFQLIDIEVMELDDDTDKENAKEFYELLQKIAFED